jgi:hypothetical protein
MLEMRKDVPVPSRNTERSNDQRMRCSLIAFRTAFFSLTVVLLVAPSLLAQAAGGTSSVPSVPSQALKIRSWEALPKEE